MRAIKIASKGCIEVRDVPEPTLRPDYVLVAVSAVALNPTDWKHVDNIPVPGATLGCDFAGIVQEIGLEVMLSIKVGDRVCGFAHGGNSKNVEDGAFAEVIAAKGDLLIRIPDHMSFEDAATLGVGTITVGLSLHQTMRLPMPMLMPSESDDHAPWLLVYGGSTATGTLAIQSARLSGMKVITTCSVKNFQLVLSRGADKAFDYHSPTCANEIRSYTGNRLFHCLDCISSDPSPEICAGALSSERSASGAKPHYVSLLTVLSFPRADIKEDFLLASVAFGESFTDGAQQYRASKASFDAAKKFTKQWSKLLAQGMIKPHPYLTRPGGLDSIVNGLDELRNSQISGAKVVYQI